MVGIPSKNWKGISQCSYWIDFVMGSCFLNRFRKKISRNGSVESGCGRFLILLQPCTNTKAGAGTQNGQNFEILKKN